jgi:chromosome segregation ATPase
LAKPQFSTKKYLPKWTGLSQIVRSSALPLIFDFRCYVQPSFFKELTEKVGKRFAGIGVAAAVLPSDHQMTSEPMGAKSMLDEYLRSLMAATQGDKTADLDAAQNGRSTKPIPEEAADTANEAQSSITDIESHANRLFHLLNELRSITERACDAALREAECADTMEEAMKAEITDLRGQLTQKDEFLQATETALADLEESANARLAQLESRIQDKDIELGERDTKMLHLASERDQLVKRSKEAELAAKQAESQARQFTERLEAEFSELKLQVTKREESLAARESTLNELEGDLRQSIQELQSQLQDTEGKLAKREKELKEKESVIQAAAVREREIGKLIQRLSSECDKLTAEVCEKGLTIAQLEDKARQFGNGGKVWKKVLGLAQEKPL